MSPAITFKKFDWQCNNGVTSKLFYNNNLTVKFQVQQYFDCHVFQTLHTKLYKLFMFTTILALNAVTTTAFDSGHDCNKVPVMHKIMIQRQNES